MSLPRFSTTVTALFAFVFYLTHFPHLSTGKETVVTDCIGLQDALNDAAIDKILIRGAILCSRINWQVPVVVHRNVELTSAHYVSHSNKEALKIGSINWTDARRVVIAERGAIIYAHDLLMLQDEMGVAGLTLPFTHTRQGATGVFTGLVIGVKFCAQPVGDFTVSEMELSRPVFLSGEQRTESINHHVLLTQDVAIWWPNLNSLWQICNSIFVCLDNMAEGQSPYELYFDSGLVTSSCAKIEKTPTLMDLLQSRIKHTMTASRVDNTNNADINFTYPSPRSQEYGNDNSTGTMGTIIIVVLVIVGVLMLTATLSYYFLCRRTIVIHSSHSNVPHDQDKSSQEDASSRNGENSSSRYLTHGNDVSINLFGGGVNVPLKDVQIGTLLGRGSFGKVYKGTWKGSPVAIKLIEHGETLLHTSLKLPFEAYLSRNVSHPNVVQTFLVYTQQKDSPSGIAEHTLDLQIETPSSQNGGAMRGLGGDGPGGMGIIGHGGGGFGGFKENSNNSSQDIFSKMGIPHSTHNHTDGGGELFVTWLVLEYCDKGSLAKAVKKGLLNQENSTEPLLDHVLLSALDVANALNYLHSLEITHSDLKADNVLLKRATSDRRGFFCKVSDFGLSKFVGKEDYVQTFTYGTLTHMPPELLKDGALSTAVDVYSFGMLLWELLAKGPPYPGKTHGDILMTVINEGRRPHITDDYPQMYADLIRDCWKQKASDRPKFMEIVKRLKRMLADLEIGNTRLRNMEEAAITSSSSGVKRLKATGSNDKRRIHPSTSTGQVYCSNSTAVATTTMPEARIHHRQRPRRTGSLTASLPVDVAFDSQTSSFNLSSHSYSISSPFEDACTTTGEMPEWDDYNSSPSVKSQPTAKSPASYSSSLSYQSDHP